VFLRARTWPDDPTPAARAERQRGTQRYGQRPRFLSSRGRSMCQRFVTSRRGDSQCSAHRPRCRTGRSQPGMAHTGSADAGADFSAGARSGIGSGAADAAGVPLGAHGVTTSTPAAAPTTPTPAGVECSHCPNFTIPLVGSIVDADGSRSLNTRNPAGRTRTRSRRWRPRGRTPGRRTPAWSLTPRSSPEAGAYPLI
jgi:hypothetical protein